MGLRGLVWGNVAKALGAGVVGATLLILVFALGARAATVDHLSIASASVTEGDAGTVSIAFTISYTGPSNNLSVGWATSNGTAIAGADFVAASGTASFSASGPKSKTITVQVMGDLLDEANETFTVTLSNAQPPATVDITTASRSGTINDNDPTPTIAINDVSIPEANSGTTMATFTLTLSTPSGRSISVRAATANGTATQPADYTSKSTTLTLAPGSTAVTFLVPVLGDAIAEANDTFFVNLTSPSNVTIADPQGVATIMDDDAIPTLRIGDASRTEGNTTTATMSFTVTLSPVSGRSVTVGYATADLTAAAPADYTAVSGTVTFSAGTTTRTISVPIVGDVTDEYNETLSVTLTTPVNATIVDDQAIGTISDDDAAPAVSIGTVTVSEGDEATTVGMLTVSLAAASSKPVSVAYATADREARASADYVPATGTLGFAPGQTTATLNVEVDGDTVDEGDETFAIALSNLVNAVSGVATGIVTIVDDDPMPFVSVDDVSVAEGDVGSATAAFTISLSAASGRLVSVDYATSGQSADGSDLPGGSGSVAFSPGQTSRTVNVLISSDRMYEGDETFGFSLSDVANAVPGDVDAIGTIINDDPVPQIAIDDRHVSEGDDGTTAAIFSVSLTNPSAFGVSVDVATADGSASSPDDYGAIWTTVTFAPGESSKSIAVDVAADAVDELDETFTLVLSNASGAGLVDDQGVGSILDDDAPNEGTADITGTWALIQVSGQDQLQSKSEAIHDALADFSTRGLSIRVPWNVLDDSLLDAGKAMADTEGKAFSIRFMAGRHTPQAVFDAGSPSYVVDGEQIPTPFYPDGSPNAVFESFYEDEVAHLAAYSRSHGIHLLHLPWYGQDWAELSNGAEVRAQPGYSEAAFIEAHRRLIDIAMRYAGEDLTVEFPMSGAGPLATIAEALTEHVIWAAGTGSPRIYVQANGLDPAGDWGAPTPAVEALMDQAVFAQPVLRGEQMRQPNDYDWAAVYANLVANGADYIEVYVNSFGGVSAAQLADQVAAFAQG